MTAAEIEIDRTKLRRAALRAALRRGDVIAATRAWERLRVDGAELAREEALAARGARAAVGRALRDARRRRAHANGTSVPAVGVPLRFESVLLRFRGAISTAALYLLLFTLFFAIYPPRPPEGAAPAAAPPELSAQAQPEPTRAPTGARGRTSATLAPVALAPAAPPEPSPTAEPTAAPTIAPATGAPVRSPSTAGVTAGVPGGVGGGVPGGTPGGVVGGVPGASGSARPTPAPTLNVLPLNPPPLAVGTDRFLFRVVDSRTGVPLSSVCVIYGTLTCGPADPHTNALGYFWLDLIGRVAANWSFRFNLDGYVSVTVNKTYRTGQGTVVTTVDLRRR